MRVNAFQCIFLKAICFVNAELQQTLLRILFPIISNLIGLEEKQVVLSILNDIQESYNALIRV